MGQLIEGRWSDEDVVLGRDGAFVRAESPWRRWVHASSDAEFPAARGRYHLYVNLGCPWAYRTVLYRSLKGLEGTISMSCTRPGMGPQGWTFEGSTGPRLAGDEELVHLHEVYARADPSFTGRITVPVLWDKETRTIVNNESSEIIRMLNSEFDAWGDDSVDYYPEDLRQDIDRWNERTYARINNGVYRCGFARSQAAYEEAYDLLFEALDEVEAHLESSPFLVGHHVTEADWRLFSTLLRFDAAYYGLFRCNRQRLVDFPNLWGYARDLYQTPGVAETVDFDAIKGIYWSRSGILPKGPAMDWDALSDRG